MRWSTFASYFLVGLLSTNSLPHFVIALTGRRNITPFGRDSSALVNALWGAINFVAGWLLVLYTDQKQTVQPNDTRRLVPYEAGCVCWALLGLSYSLKTAKEPTYSE